MPETRVHGEVFTKFPTFRRGIVVALGMDNRRGSEELQKLLNEAVAAASAAPVDLDADPRAAAWNQVYRELGCNPKKFPPAHLALLKRVQKPGATIPFINKAVAVMNDNSIRGVLPVGGDDLAGAGKTLELRPAEGDERFRSLSDPDRVEQPEVGEIIYVVSESREVMCRRWNWRNGFPTRITEETRDLVMNIDGVGPDAESRVIPIRDRVAGMLARYCGAEVTTALLGPSRPAFAFDA